MGKPLCFVFLMPTFLIVAHIFLVGFSSVFTFVLSPSRFYSDSALHANLPAGSPSFRVICRGAIHCVPIQADALAMGRNELRPYTISSRFTRKDAEPAQNSGLRKKPWKNWKTSWRISSSVLS
jgi:hypothetical protein